MSAINVLEKYLPQRALPLIDTLIDDYSVIIRIKRGRKTKFGDYRCIRDKWKHQITVNHDLSPPAFLITLVHEIAHMHTFEKFQWKAAPHGHEWKACYVDLLSRFVKADIFESEIAPLVERHLRSPAASSCVDTELYKSLKEMPDEASGQFHLEDLPEGELFLWRESRVFRKDGLLRKRYRCTEVATQKVYFFHPLAEVERIPA